MAPYVYMSCSTATVLLIVHKDLMSQQTVPQVSSYFVVCTFICSLLFYLCTDRVLYTWGIATGEWNNDWWK